MEIQTGKAIVPILTIAGCLYYLKTLTKKPKLRIKSLHVYPIKSCSSIDVEEISLTNTGLLYDRKWVVVKGNKEAPNHIVYTQRQLPKLVLVKPVIKNYGEEETTCFGEKIEMKGLYLILKAPNMENFYMKIKKEEEREEAYMTDVELFGETFSGIDEGEEIAEWFTRYLGKECRVVCLSESTNERTMPEEDIKRMPAVDEEIVEKTAYVDEHPLLVTFENSLRDLNNRISDSKSKITMKNFRPNIVLEEDPSSSSFLNHLPPFSEDSWGFLKFVHKDITFVSTGKKVRCVMTTVNPETGIKPKGFPKDNEPFKTLMKYRAFADYRIDRPTFGQAFSFPTSNVNSSISVGDLLDFVVIEADNNKKEENNNNNNEDGNISGEEELVDEDDDIENVSEEELKSEKKLDQSSRIYLDHGRY
eukprot:TRINITY_DN9679_c0_g1_i2.p1 TRINITY_DN9679_c0_g1~~TRINITY_DN9679_c0_g1_i2.p1  ORF type:complete len:418 (-),score=149.60 TRINITY_DN9679_c0_g1_i2:25-1278(-)